jgi:predicted transcriptional regulator
MYLTTEEIGKRVKRELRSTQKEIAEELDISQATVSQALDGKKRQRQTLFRIARKEGCEVGEEPYFFFKLPTERS